MDNIARLISLVHSLGEFITAMSVLGGIFFGAASIFILFDAAKPVGASQGNLRYLPWTLIACAFLINIGNTVSSLRQTTFVSDGYYPSATAEPYTWRTGDAFASHNHTVALATLITEFMALVGYTGIVRGVWMLPRINRPPNPASVSHILAYIIGGTLMLEPATVLSTLAYYFSVLGPFASFLNQAV